MTTTSNTDLKQLKEFISDRFNQLDGKIEQVREDIKGLDRRLRDIELNQAETKGRMDEWKTSIQKIPDLAEKVGELKNWRQIAFVVIAAIVSGFLGWIARGGKIS
jgi:phage-related minor tail protein